MKKNYKIKKNLKFSFKKIFKFNFIKKGKVNFLKLNSRQRRITVGGAGIMLVLGVVFAINVSNIRGATFGWLQTDWSGGADTNAVATHATNQSGWTKFYSKDANVDTSNGEVKMSATSTSFVTTTDADFNAGTGVLTYVSGDAVMARKPNGGACTSNAMCINDVCQANVCAGPWIVGSCAGIEVYKADVSGTKQWKNSNTVCVGPQCATGLDTTYPANYSLVADNGQTFGTTYPAREACKVLGGRLPTITETNCIYTYRTQYNIYVAFQNAAYWAATENNITSAWEYNPVGGSTGSSLKANSRLVRCVKNQ